MERGNPIEIGRPVESHGSLRLIKPFRQGEKLPVRFPHTGPNGEHHKGNLIVVSTDGLYDDSGYAGWTAVAQCPLKKCDYTVEVKAINEPDK
jgi:hypothetical protein